MSAGQEVLCSQGEAGIKVPSISLGARAVGGILINEGQPGAQRLGEVMSPAVITQLGRGGVRI